ncbi:MAG: double zinc ribbon domain-containing protein [Gammaproteobacteria bacterium]
MTWRRVDQVLDALFPPRCLLCGQVAGGAEPACAGCLADLPWLETSPEPPAPLAEVRCALTYVYPVDRLVAAAKFGRQVPVARGLGQLLHWRMPAVPEPPDAVVPVPLHWRREASRGFNQAEEIARGLCDRRGWPLRTDLCRRVRQTPEQSGLAAPFRRDNLRGAFALLNARAIERCQHVLLVDDVLTTGATATTLAAEFSALGVPRLSLWTVAWTPPSVPSTVHAADLKV